MAIIKIEAFTVECDKCKERYVSHAVGRDCFLYPESVKHSAENDGWWFLETEKCYCDKCVINI